MSYLDSFKKDARALEDQIVQIMFYMRGSVSREEAWHLSFNERQAIVKLIEANIERVNKTGLPIL